MELALEEDLTYPLAKQESEGLESRLGQARRLVRIR